MQQPYRRTVVRPSDCRFMLPRTCIAMTYADCCSSVAHIMLVLWTVGLPFDTISAQIVRVCSQ